MFQGNIPPQLVTYTRRIFDRTFRYIGLCEINDADVGAYFNSKIRKREILDKIFSFVEPHNK